MGSRVCVVILNWNGKKDTVPCLESMEKIAYPNFEVVMVDNGSTDDSVKAIRQRFDRVTVVETGKNLGYAGGNNIGIEYALKTGADLVLLLNNDTVVDEKLLDAFVKEAKDRPEVGIFGARPLRFFEPDKLDHLGGVWNEKKGEFNLIGLQERSDFTYEGELDYVCGCSVLVRREVFEKIGLLEAAFFLFWEEADFCMRAKRAGFRIGICDGAKLWHKVSASFVGGKPHVAYFWWRNRFLWIERNLSRQDRWRLFWKVLLPQVGHLYKLRALKGLELKVLKILRSKKDLKEKEQKLHQYRASLQGFHDYVRRRFGNIYSSES